MSRFTSFLKRIVLAIRRFFAWIWRQIVWVMDQIGRLLAGIFGPPYEWFIRGLRAVKVKIEWAIDWILSIIRRIFKPASHGQRVKEERIGANVTPLLATLTLAAVWYLVPVARWIEYGPLRFVIVGFLLWIVALAGWLSRCREDRTGQVARFTQRVGRSTGLRRLDQLAAIPALWLCYLTFREIQLLPLAMGSVVAVLALLTIEHEYRPQLAAPLAPAFTASIVRPTSGRTVDRDLTWTVTAHGHTQRHVVTVTIDTDELETARTTNPGEGPKDDIATWVEHGRGPEVEELAKNIHDLCFEGAYSLFATVSCFVAASQAVRYVTDSESTGKDEYWRYPIETLADGVGDCEDSAILLAALLRRAGFRCAIILVPGHAAVAVEVPNDTPGSYFERDGIRYYYCETTQRGWKVGQVPSHVDMEQATFVPVPPWTMA